MMPATNVTATVTLVSQSTNDDDEFDIDNDEFDSVDNHGSEVVFPIVSSEQCSMTGFETRMLITANVPKNVTTPYFPIRNRSF